MLADLYPNEGPQLHDHKTDLTISTDLVTMERRKGSISNHHLVFKTRCIAQTISDEVMRKTIVSNYQGN